MKKYRKNKNIFLELDRHTPDINFNQKLKKILGYNKFQDFAKGIKSTIQFDLN